MRYRVKPVIVGAVQWTGTNVQEIVDFVVESLPPSSALRSIRFDFAIGSPTTVTVSTQEHVAAVIQEQVAAVMTATVDDWVLLVDGRISSVKPDAFVATYDPEP